MTRNNIDTTNIDITLSESKYKENDKDSNDIDDNPIKHRKSVGMHESNFKCRYTWPPKTETVTQWRKAGTLESEGSITVTYPSSNTAGTSVGIGIHHIGYCGKYNINTSLDWNHPNL